MESLIGVMEKVTTDEGRRREIWGRVLDLDGDTPYSYLDNVYSKYTTAEEKTHALADVYVNIRSDSSWQHLVLTLYAESELAAAEEAKSFLGSRSVCVSVCLLPITPYLVYKSKYCIDFTENASFSSFGVINFANAKLLDFRHSTF